MPKLSFELIKDLNNLKDEWNDLIDRMEEPEIFYRYEWADNYIKYYEPGRKVCIVTGRTGEGKLVCLLPFSYDNRVINFITRESADYNSIYVDLGFNRYDVISKAFEFLIQNIEVNKICLLNMKDNSELFLLQDILRINGFSTFLEESVIVPYISPNMSSEKIKKDRLKSTERHERHFKSDYTVSYRETRYLDIHVLEFIRNHKEKKYGNNALNKDNVIDFYIHLAEQLGANLVVNTLYADDQLVAAHMGYRTDKKFYYYIPIYDKSFSKYGVGMILLKHMIEENKDIIFDFLKGNEPYKFYWCDNATMNFHLLAYKKNMDSIMPRVLEKIKNNKEIRRIMGR